VQNKSFYFFLLITIAVTIKATAAMRYMMYCCGPDEGVPVSPDADTKIASDEKFIKTAIIKDAPFMLLPSFRVNRQRAARYFPSLILLNIKRSLRRIAIHIILYHIKYKFATLKI